MYKILFTDDDVKIRSAVKDYFTANGFDITTAENGEKAVELADIHDFDLIILDVMMPIKDGFTVAKEIRRVDKKIPILFLTAKNLEADKLKGFEIGADDYITKPFSMDELLARLNATIRRSFDDGRPDKNVFNIGNFVFDYTHQTLTLDGDVRRLTSKEAELLRMFAQNYNNLVDRNSTLQKIWKDDSYFAARSMDVYITKLRKYLKDDPSVQILNVHGVGFKLTVVKDQ